MTFLHYKNSIENSLKKIIKELEYEYENPQILETSRLAFGNAYTTIAFLLAKNTKKNQ